MRLLRKPVSKHQRPIRHETQPKSRGLGDVIESALSSVGVTQEAVFKWLGVPCNCEERKQKLNQLSTWARRVVKGHTEGAIRFLNEMIGQ